MRSSITPFFAFDVCHDRYRTCYAESFEHGHLHATGTVFLANTWKPGIRPAPEDFCADFAMLGKKALEREGLHSRVALFQQYYISLLPYEQSRHWFGLSEMGWCRFTEDIRRVVGKELIREELFPPKRYFQELSWRLREQEERVSVA